MQGGFLDKGKLSHLEPSNSTEPAITSPKDTPLRGDLGGDERFFQITEKSGMLVFSSSIKQISLHKTFNSGSKPGGPGID